MRFDAPPVPRACRRSEFGLLARWNGLGRRPYKRRTQIRPPGLTRGPEGLADLRSHSQKGGVERVDRLPTEHRQIHHRCDETARAGPRPRRDEIRQNRRCNAHSWDGSARRRMAPARPGRRGGKAQRPARRYRRAQPGQIRQKQRADFAPRRHRRRQCRAGAAQAGWISREVPTSGRPSTRLDHANGRPASQRPRITSAASA